MRKSLIVGVLSLGMAVSGGLAMAQPASKAQPAKKAPSAVAMELSKLALPQSTYDQMVSQMTQGMLQGSQASGATPPADAAQKLTRVVKEALPYAEMLQFNAQVYGERFSDKELGDIIAFYKTPTGSKVVREMPGIMQEVGLKVGEILPQRMPELMKKHGLIQ